MKKTLEDKKTSHAHVLAESMQRSCQRWLTGTMPPPTNSNGILHGTRKQSTLKFLCKNKETLSRSNPEEKGQCWRYPNTWFQVMFQIHSIKPVCCWHKDRQIHKGNRAEGPATNSRSYGLLIFGKDDKTHIEEKTVSLTNGFQ